MRRKIFHSFIAMMGGWLSLNVLFTLFLITSLLITEEFNFSGVLKVFLGELFCFNYSLLLTLMGWGLLVIPVLYISNSQFQKLMFRSKFSPIIGAIFAAAPVLILFLMFKLVGPMWLYTVCAAIVGSVGVYLYNKLDNRFKIKGP